MTFLTVVGADIKGFDTDRDIFLGPYRDYSNPLVVENGVCQNSLAAGDNACGTLQFDVDLEAGESRTVLVLLGIGSAAVEGKMTVSQVSDTDRVDRELAELKKYWHSRIQGMTVHTPDSEFNSMMNMWNPYNCLITYAWSRSASLVYNGERDGLGYRDTVQDILGVLHTIPDEAKERLELMISGQVSSGGAMPVVKPFAHNPGRETAPREEDYRSDDCLWLFYTVPGYVKETGNLQFYHKELPYADKGKDTVLGHLKRAIQFNIERSGAHGLSCGLFADWNDCLELGHKGETVFVSFQLRYALQTYIEICQLFNYDKEIEWAKSYLEKLDKNLENHAWDGKWYVRAFRDDGLKFGSNENTEASIFLNSQSWAIMSGHASGERAKKVLDIVYKRLSTDYGLMLCDPPVKETDPKVIKAVLFNPGMKENASIFNHSQGWAVIAETMLGMGDRAFEHYRKFMPAAYNTTAEIREIEPYIYCQSTHSKYSSRNGASRLSWLSGAASWAYYASTQFILGIQPDYEGLKIDPCIPSDWNDIKITRKFRKKEFNIIIKNQNSVQKGVKFLSINGDKIKGNLIHLDKMKAKNDVLVELG